MSSTITAGSITPWVTPITMGYLPREGTREANSQYNWANQSSYTDDLTQLQSVAGLSTIQGVLIHNRGNAQSVTLTVAGTGQSLTCPARSEATFPLIMGMTAPQITITVNGASTATTRCNWLNYPVSATVWNAPVLVDPVIDLNFENGSVTVPPMTFARANATATDFDSTGTLQTLAANVPRIDYGGVPNGTTNWVPNSTMAGAVVGVGNNVPGWSASSAPGVNKSIVGLGTINGIPYADIRVNGVATGSGSLKFNLALSGSPSPGVIGQQWNCSAWVQLIADNSTVPITGVAFELSQTGGVTTFVGGSSIPVASLATFQRQSQAIVTNNPNAMTGVVMSLWSSGATAISGDTIDITVRVGAPQFELGTAASTWVPTSGTIASSSTPLGLLIEETRTNAANNPRAEGSTIGPIGGGGVAPTSWSVAAPAGALLTSAIIGSGVENGIGFCDVAFTANGSGAFECSFLTGPAAANGQSWTGSAYAKLVGGSNANVVHSMTVYETGGTLQSTSTAFVPGPGSLASQRTVVTKINTAVGTTAELFRYHFAVSGVASWTIRLGGPQLELGAFATSLIQPPPGAPAATVRGGDQASIAEVTTVSSGVVAMTAIKPAATAPADMWLFSGSAPSQVARAFFRNAGVEPVAALENTATATIDQSGSFIGSAFGHAMQFTPAVMSACANGGPVLTTPVVGTLATNWSGFTLGGDSGFGAVWNGWIQRFRFWTRTMGAGELQSVSTPT